LCVSCLFQVIELMLGLKILGLYGVSVRDRDPPKRGKLKVP